MDATLQGLPLNEKIINKIIKEIISINLEDNTYFEMKNVKSIKIDDEYNNYRVSLVGIVERTRINLKVDITTGDPITPRAITYNYPCIFENEVINIYAYPIETILADKYETIISRNISNTRMRDFYDIYMLYKIKGKEINYQDLKKAVLNTSINRASLTIIKNAKEILINIEKDNTLNKLWNNYVKDEKYVGNLQFRETIAIINKIFGKINL